MAGGVPRHELFHRYSEYSFDAFRVADRDLDMCFFAEARAGVDGWAFGEDGFEGVDRGPPIRFQNRMQASDYSTIKFPP